MLNRKGMTLVETLYAFSLFMVLVLSLINLMNMSFNQEKHIVKLYTNLQQDEVSFISAESIVERIERVLH